ncbi:MAG TPA: shikimate dehydrogenase [Vicinamibacterales bacterium]|nr:shikimate dehydrogenase [Vicinamibacterales bacterium]
MGKDVEALRRERTVAEADADLVELRVDSMERPDPAAALAGRRKPAIVTCRPVREGGMFAGTEEDRLRILWDAHAAGADFVDVEMDADVGRLIEARGGRGVIVSKHDFDKTPADAAELIGRLRAAGGEVAKLAVMTETLSDLRTLLSAARPDCGSVLIGMGAAGLMTRVLAGRFGSRWTYAGDSIAPGQLPVDRLLHEYRFRRIRSDAGVYALLGRPAAHSLSPAMHNAGFAALDMNAAYVPIETRDLREFRAFAAAAGIRGASVTIPFKRDVMSIVDELSPIAAEVGAVNTLALRDGRWIGTNTDADGFLEPLRRRIPSLDGLRATILGAGGAARAVGLALARRGVRIAIAARRAPEAQAVAAAVGAGVAAWPPPRQSWDLLINATPVGSRTETGTPFPGPFDGRIVYDLVYDPDPTPLMRAAEDAGCSTIGGLEMLVAQAERQFEIWTGRRPPQGLFAEAAATAIKNRSATSVSSVGS